MKKKLLLGIGLPLSLVPMALVACGSSGEENKLSERSEFRVAEIVAKERPLYDFSYNYSFAQDAHKLSSLIGTELFQQASEDEMYVNARGQNQKKVKTYYKLGMAKAIHITKSDGNVAVYNSDEREKQGIVVEENWQKYISDVTSSINNPKFLEDLSGAKKIQMTLKDDVYWVDKDGKKTKYKVTLEDYYAHVKSILFSINPLLRRSSGGSAAADDLADKKWNNRDESIKTMFSEKSSMFDNFYLLPLFGINRETLLKKETFISKTTSNEDSFTLESLDQSKGGSFENLFTKILLGTTYFMARPSEYIKDNKAKDVNNSSGEVSDYGYYWYGGKWDEMVFAGPYYPKLIRKESELWNQNEQYHDQEWVKNPKSVKSFSYEFKALDSETFTNNTFNQFKDNAVDSLDFTILNDVQKREVLTNPRKFNLSYWVTPRRDQTVRGTVLWNGTPTYKTDVTPDYNDVFSKLMYGKKTSELRGDNVNISKHYWLGDGLRFRSLLSNAINFWSTSLIRDTNFASWKTSAAPGNVFGGKNQETTELSSVLKAREIVEKSFAFNKSFEKIAIRNWEDDKKHYENPENQRDNKVAAQSSTFASIKAEMKILLDDFYRTNTEFEGKKVEFTYYPRYNWITTKELSALQSLLPLLNSLDDRIKVSHPTWTDEVNKKINGLASSGRHLGWGYDYDGIGTWLDGIFHPSQGASNELNLLYQFADLEQNDTLAKQLPQLYKFAKTMKNDASLFPSGTPSFEERKNASTRKWIENPIEWLKGTSANFDPVVAHSQFFFKYQLDNTNEDLALLVQEIEAVLGFHPGSRSGSMTNPEKPVPLIRSQVFTVPLSPQGKTLSKRYVEKRNITK